MSAAVESESRTRLAGIGLLIVSTLIFACSNVLAKWSTIGFPVGEVLFVRSLVSMCLIAPFVRPVDVVIALRTNPLVHLLRVTLSTSELACFYVAVSTLQLADVTTFYLSSPILLTIISAVALREGIDRRRWIATFVGFAGVLIALRPSGAAFSLPALTALAGSAMYSVVLATTRLLRRTPNVVLVVLQLLAVLVASAVTLPFAWVMPSFGQFAMLGLVGAVSILGYLAVARALQLAPASVVAPFNYLSIIWSVAFGYFVFADVPDRFTLAGAAVIIAAGMFILLHERRRTA